MAKMLTAIWENGSILLSDGTKIDMEGDYTLNFINPQVAVIGDNEITITTAVFHLHTGYSLLDGQIKIPELAKKISNGTKEIVVSKDGRTVKFTEYPQIVAITDHGNMFGSYQFSQTMRKNGITPIIGCEVYAESLNGKKDSNHLVLLAKTEAGYKNLVKLVSLAEENMYNKPHISWEMLKKYSKGLVCLSGCLGGEIPQRIMDGDFDGALEVAENFLDIFEDDFYIEIQNHALLKEDEVRPQLLKLAKELGIKVVATTDSHILNKDSELAHEILLCIGTGKTMSDPKHFRFEGTNYHVQTNDEFNKLFMEWPESFETHAEIASKCSYVFEKAEIEMPDFPTENSKTLKETFEEECWKGFSKRFDGTDINVQEYTDRLNYEMSIIGTMDYEAYFLIVADFIAFAKRNDIAVGPGRGSAVGSLVAFVLDITDLDPIPYGLLFERFLNPDRVSMPDIDIDFQDNRRHEVINYVKEKYGDDHVSRIVTFGTLAAKMVIRDVARAMDIPAYLSDKLAKTIPVVPNMTIEKAFKESPEFLQMYKTDKTVQKVVDIAKQLEGLTRHKSQHACGIVISKKPVSDYVPEVILTDKHGNEARTAGFTMTELEDLGLMKMDFLGLRNMTIIGQATKTIGVPANKIPLDDPYVYELLSSGATDGIFQVESPGMKSLMKDMFYDVSAKIKHMEKKYGVSSFVEAEKIPAAKKDFKSFGQECFERLIAAISLYRPGPMDYIPQYIEGMKDPKSIHYDTPQLEKILAGTYGTIVYQEQVQQIVRDLAGYSLGRGDLIRRAMGKKKRDVMEKEKEIFLNGNKVLFDSKKDSQFVPGCNANGIATSAANVVWDKMDKFAEYAFNKSHAAGYAVIAAQTGWLKKYHETEFWVQTLNSVINASKKLKKYISSAKKSGINILRPDVNLSESVFTAVNADIRMGLSSLRNLGKESLPIIEERKNGEFKSFEDFVLRTMPDKRAYESLVFSGALDMFEGTRAAKIISFEQISEIKTMNNKYNKVWFNIPEIDEWYNSLFNIEIQPVPEMIKMDMLNQEYKFAGMYVTEHPLDQYEYVTSSFEHQEIADLSIDDEEDDDSLGQVNVSSSKPVTVVGIIKELETKITKKGDVMYVFEFEDNTGSIRTTVFPRQAEVLRPILREDALVRIDGTWENNDFGVQIIVENIVELYKIVPDKSKKYVVSANSENIGKVLNILDKYVTTGKDSVYVEIDFGGNSFFINKDVSSKKRGIKVEELEANKDKILKIDSGIATFLELRKVSSGIKKK